jgi:beta-glucuronidase
MYKAWQEEFSPAIIELSAKKDGQAIISITARKDFPAYTMKGYQLRYNNHLVTLNTLRPGDNQQLNIVSPGSIVEIELVKPGGFVIMKKILK